MSSFMNKSSDPRLQAYTAVRQIGKGSYGEVFLVRHTKEKKQYVIKNIKLTASSAKERLAAEQEAALLGQLKHPNIVSYKESFQDEHSMLHIVMGYCEGGDLCTRLKSYKGQYLPETQVVEWFVQIALALQYLHERNILHRDLKTQNIFLSKNDIIKVGDLGIARVLDGSCDLAHTVIGTPYYMSPELFANEPYNHKSDIWALGCCVYEMATLKHAFTATNLNALMYKIIKGKVPALPSTFSQDLSELVKQMMAHRADHRPSVHQLLRNSFVRRHITLFLDRAASKRRKSSKPPPLRAASVPTGLKQGAAQGRGRSSSVGSSKQQEGTPSKQPCGDDQNKKTSSLTNLPQDSGGANQSRESVCVITPNGSKKILSEGNKPSGTGKNERKKQDPQRKRPPRPLPPDPLPKSGSPVKSRYNPLTRKISSSDSPKPMSGENPKVSSARERRRRSKQLEGGGVRARVVLRSRSSSDLSKGEKSESSSRAESESEDVADGPSNTPADPLVSESKPMAEPLTSVSGVDSALPNGSKAQEHELRDSGSSNEVDDFLTLLDTTLHLPEPPPVRADSEDTPQPRQAFIQHQPLIVSEVSESILQSGRLGDRIVALRRECVIGLGDELMKEAALILEQNDPEEAEELLLKALGRKLFDKYAGKLQHLNFCEDNVRTPLV